MSTFIMWLKVFQDFKYLELQQEIVTGILLNCLYWIAARKNWKPCKIFKGFCFFILRLRYIFLKYTINCFYKILHKYKGAIFFGNF